MSKVSNHNDYNPLFDRREPKDNGSHTQGFAMQQQLSDGLSGKGFQPVSDMLSSKGLPEQSKEMDLVGSPKVVLASGVMSDKYLKEQGFEPVTKDSVRVYLGVKEDEGKYAIDLQAFYNSSTDTYNYRITVRVLKDGKYESIDPEKHPEFNAFLISNYGFDFQELQGGEHFDFDKKSKQYLTKNMTPLKDAQDALSLNVNGGFEIPEGEAPEKTNRRFAIELVRSMYAALIHEYNSMVKQFGGLDFGYWHELLKMGVQGVSDVVGIEDFFYSSFARMGELAKRLKEDCNLLEKAIDEPDRFNDLFKAIIGQEYSNEKFQELRDIRHKGLTADDTDQTMHIKCLKKFDELYPDNSINRILEKWDTSLTEKIDTIGDIVVMLLLTRGIGAGARAAGKEVLKEIAKKNVKLAMSKFVTFSNAIAQTTATMSLFEGSKTLVRGATNGENWTSDKLISETLASLKSGALMGFEIALMEVFAISPLTNKLSKVFGKYSSASAKVAELAKNGGISVQEAMEIYTKSARSIQEAVHIGVAIPTMTIGFTAIETAKAAFDNGDVEEYRKFLLEKAVNQQEADKIKNMSDDDIKTEFHRYNLISKAETNEEVDALLAMDADDIRLEYALDVAKEQVTSFTTIEGMGVLFKQVQAARIARKAMAPSYTNIIDAKLVAVEENGITTYEFITPENKPLKFTVGENGKEKIITRFANPEDAMAAYSVLNINIAQLIASEEEANAGNDFNTILTEIREAKTQDELSAILAEIDSMDISNSDRMTLEAAYRRQTSKLIMDELASNNEDLNRDVFVEQLEQLSKSRQKNISETELDEKIDNLPDGEFKEDVLKDKRIAETMSGIPSIAQRMRNSISRLIDVNETFNKLTEQIKSPDLKDSVIKMYNKIIMDEDSTVMGKTRMIESLTTFVRNKSMSESQRFMSYLEMNHPEIYDELKKSPDEIDNPKYRELKEDFLKFKKFEDTIIECRVKAGTREADELYEKYIEGEFVSDNKDTENRIKRLCRDINKQFGVKVFLPSRLKEAGVALEMVYAELARYKMHAEQAGQGAVLKLPPTLDFYTNNIRFIKSSVGGTHKAVTDAISINTLTTKMVKDALAHEIMHCNDLFHLEEFPEGINPLDYKQEFDRAGLSTERFKYACTSPVEFIAVAAEGDISKYSEGFRAVLEQLGMPKWMFSMSRGYTPEEKAQVRLVNKIYDDLENNNIEEKLLDELADELGVNEDFTKRDAIKERIELLIDRVKEAVRKGEVLTVEKLAEDCNLTVNQVRGLMYSGNHEELADQIRQVTRTRKRKDTEKTEQKAAQKLVETEQRILDELEANFPGFAKRYLDQKLADGSPRFTVEQIANLAEIPDEILGKIMPLVNHRVWINKDVMTYKYTGDCIDAIIDTYKEGNSEKIELLEKLLHGDKSVYPDGKVELLPSNIILEKLAEFDSTHPKKQAPQPQPKPKVSQDDTAVSVARAIKGLDGNPYYSDADIEIIEDVQKRFPGFTKRLLQQKSPDGSPRFTASQIANITKFCENHFDKLMELINAKAFSGLGILVYKYTGDCIDAIIKTYNEGNPEKIELAERLLNGDKEVYPKDNVPTFPSDVIIKELAKFDGKETTDDVSEVGSAFASESEEILVPEETSGFTPGNVRALRIQARIDDMKAYFNELIEMGEQVSAKQVAEIFRISPTNFSNMVSNPNYGLSELWNKVKATSHGRYSKDEISPEVQARINTLKTLLTDALSKNEPMPLQEIASKLGISLPLASRMLTNKTYGLADLWIKVKNINSASRKSSSAEVEEQSSVNRKYEFKKPDADIYDIELRTDAAGTYEELFEKGQRLLSNLLRNLPDNANVKEPKVISVGNNHFGFTIETTPEGNRFITVKNWLGDKEAWDVSATVEEGFSFEVDGNNQMIRGKYFSGDNFETEYSYTFERNKDGESVITYQEDKYGYKSFYRNSATPTRSSKQEFIQSNLNPDSWVAKLDNGEGFDGKEWRFAEEVIDSELSNDEFGYEPGVVNLMNMFLDYARPGREVLTEKKKIKEVKPTEKKETKAEVKPEEAPQTPPIPAGPSAEEVQRAKLAQANAELIQKNSEIIVSLHEFIKDYAKYFTAEEIQLIDEYNALMKDVEIGKKPYSEVDNLIFEKLIDLKENVEQRTLNIGIEIEDAERKLSDIEIELEICGIEFDLECYKPHDDNTEVLDDAKFVIETFRECGEDYKKAIEIIEYCEEYRKPGEKLNPERKSDLDNPTTLKNYRSWVSNIKNNNVNLTLEEYLKMRTELQMSEAQIFSNGTSILDVFGLKDFKEFMQFVDSNANDGKRTTIQTIFKLFGQKDIDGLKQFFNSNNIKDFKSLNSDFYTFSLLFNGRNMEIKDNIADLMKMFRRIHGPVDLTADYETVVWDEVDKELLKFNYSKRVKGDKVYHGYPNILAYLNIDYINDNVASKMVDSQMLNGHKYSDICRTMNNQKLASLFPTIHGRMRFIERHLLKDGIDISNPSKVDAYLDSFRDKLKEALNNQVLVTRSDAQNGRVALRLETQTKKGSWITVIINSDGLIHTIY